MNWTSSGTTGYATRKITKRKLPKVARGSTTAKPPAHARGKLPIDQQFFVGGLTAGRGYKNGILASNKGLIQK